jgi:type IV pilus assembly protein PilF
MERYLSVAKHTAESLWLAAQTERALGNNKLAADYSQQLLTSFPSSQQAQQIKSAISN